MNNIKRYGESILSGIIEEKSSGWLVEYKDYATLKAERDALVAENATLEVAIGGVYHELYGQGFEVVGWHLNGDLEPLDSWFEENNWNPETPATDAAIAKIQAQGVEMALNLMGNFTSDEFGDSVYLAVKELSAQLCKEIK